MEATLIPIGSSKTNSNGTCHGRIPFAAQIIQFPISPGRSTRSLGEFDRPPPHRSHPSGRFPRCSRPPAAAPPLHGPRWGTPLLLPRAAAARHRSAAPPTGLPGGLPPLLPPARAPRHRPLPFHEPPWGTPLLLPRAAAARHRSPTPPSGSLGCCRRFSRRLRTLPLLLPPAATATAVVACRQPPWHLDPRPRRGAHHRDGPPLRCTVATVACGAPSAAPVVSPAPLAATSAVPAASPTAPAAAGFLMRHRRHWSLAARPPLPSVAFCVPPRSCQLPSTILRYAARPLLHGSLFIECGGAYVGRARLRRMVLTAEPVLTVCG